MSDNGKLKVYSCPIQGNCLVAALGGYEFDNPIMLARLIGSDCWKSECVYVPEFNCEIPGHALSAYLRQRELVDSNQ